MVYEGYVKHYMSNFHFSLLCNYAFDVYSF